MAAARDTEPHASGYTGSTAEEVQQEAANSHCSRQVDATHICQADEVQQDLRHDMRPEGLQCATAGAFQGSNETLNAESNVRNPAHAYSHASVTLIRPSQTPLKRWATMDVLYQSEALNRMPNHVSLYVTLQDQGQNKSFITEE